MDNPTQNLIAILFEFGVHPGGPRHGLWLRAAAPRIGDGSRCGIVVKQIAANREPQPGFQVWPDCRDRSRRRRAIPVTSHHNQFSRNATLYLPAEFGRFSTAVSSGIAAVCQVHAVKASCASLPGIQGESGMSVASGAVNSEETATIIDEIRESHPYEVVVEHRGMWQRGVSYPSLDKAIACSRDAWSRSRLRTQVRNTDGVVFAKFPQE